MLASTYNAGSMLCSDYGPLEWIGGHDSGVYRGRGNDGRYVALRFCAIDTDPARSALIEMVYAASLVRHPMLTAVAGCQSYAGGALCLVSEYVPGQSLDRWVAAHGRPPLRITIDFIRRLSLGLHAAHQRGLTHHALHPGNLMVLQPDTQPGGRIVAKLLDLGVPAFVRPWPPRSAAVPYTAPELLDATAPSSPLITPLTNVYSTGALLHYLCTGVAPERDADGQLNAAAIRWLAPEIPGALERVIVRALSADPHARPASAAELASALGRVESEWRISGVHRREGTIGETDPGQVLGGDGESLAMLHTRQSRPPAAGSFQRYPRSRRSTELPANDAVMDRVHPQVPRPSTGSFPRIEIPAGRRWVAGLTLASLLALYFVALPSGAKRPAAPSAPRAAELELARTRRAAADPLLETSRPIELSLETSRPLELPPPASLESENAPLARSPAMPTPAPGPSAAPLPPAKTERLRAKRQSSTSPPTAAGSLVRERAPIIPPAPLPASDWTVAVQAPRIAQPRPVASETESAAQRSQPSAASGASAPIEVQVAAVNVRGSLTVSVVRRAIERIRPMLTQCYRRHLKPGQALAPSLQVSATIDEVGRVRSPSVAGGTLPALNDCVVKATAKMVSEAPDTGIVRASWRLSL